MKFSNPATAFAILLALIVSLVACNPVAGTPTAALIVTRATVAPETPIFPMVSYYEWKRKETFFPLDTISIINLLSPSKTAVTCAISRPYFMGFTRPYYAKRAISKLFHKKTFYGSEPGAMVRVECSINAGIFVENKVSKLFSPPIPIFF